MDTFARLVAEIFEGPDSEPGDDDDLLDLSATYIHLRAARVFTSGSAQPLPEMLWRGRLSHVSGWSVGAMRASSGT
jgi:hypothetical protein